MTVRTVPCVLGEHVTLDATRSNTVDGDTTATEVSSESLDHANDSHLRSVVKSVVADAKQTGSNRRHEDQTTVVLKVLPRSLADEELGASVEVEHVVVLLLGDLLSLVPALGAGVAHDDVDLAEVRLGLLEEALDLGGLADVGLDGDGFGAGAGLLDELDDLVGRLFAVGVVDDDAGATAAELNGAATTDTTAGTGDEGDLSVEGGSEDGDGTLRHDCGGLVVVWVGGSVVVGVEVNGIETLRLGYLNRKKASV